MRQPGPHTAVRRRAGEAGSAYIIALLALVVLSILGLGLALITQTEMQVGAGEMTYQRLLYSADSGTARGVASAFAHYNCAPIAGTDNQIADQDLSTLMSGSKLRQETAVTASIMVMSPPARCARSTTPAAARKPVSRTTTRSITCSRPPPTAGRAP